MELLVALSGGVDSSVAAALLVEAGHEVVGVTMKLWGGESDTGCCSVSDVDDARRVAQQLDIAFHVFNFGDEFEAHVVEPYVAAHAQGITPNPCIECNRHLKFDRLLDRAEQLGFDQVATGHHARIDHSGDHHYLARGADPDKDQSYVLYMLDQRQLSRVRFPIGHLTKQAVRDEAARLGLRTAHKADSQDVCFITSTQGREGFLERRIDLHPGTVVDGSGAEVGSVTAVELVTIGQRRGLGIEGGPIRYVTDVDVAQRRVTIGDAPDREVTELHLRQLVWAADPVAGSIEVQCSAHGMPVAATIGPTADDRWLVRLTSPIPRVAPGQSAVFYLDDRVIGGGIVERG